MAHFVTECEALDGVRRRFGVDRGDPLEVTTPPHPVLFLFGRRTGKEVKRTTKMLEEMYGARRKKIEEQVDICRRSEGVSIGRLDPALYQI